MIPDKPIIVIGGGLAGCEAAWQLLTRGHPVVIYEMKPETFSPAHKSPHLAELVCSNSLRSDSTGNAAGLLKEEMRIMNSLIIEAADRTAVPAGKALAVDRTRFSIYVEEKLLSQGRLTIIRKELQEIPADHVVIIATGPLTSDPLAKGIAEITGSDYLYFYDAISPIIEGDSIDYTKVFRASRYSGGEGDYLNCPMERAEYEQFWQALIEGGEVPLRPFEELKFFSGCLPIEVLARSGKHTLAFGPMKPVGLLDPKTGKQPFAAVQLRQEDEGGRLFNMVGFQTKLTWPEQRRILRMIPGLENAEFARYGSIHRNTFINSPALLRESLQLRTRDNVFFAGQITGAEGYVESAAIGLLSGLSVSSCLSGRVMTPPPATTALGAMLQYIIHADQKKFQPMNINFGIFPPITEKVPKKGRGQYYAERSLKALRDWKERQGYDPSSSMAGGDTRQQS
ncbi:MAG: methylenetetrahydrofolate--tRNA-(uracil(54)-C(5))-methyltransferase (FADH(2)-oxidizing) TrmFO [Syntrophales bacterium]